MPAYSCIRSNNEPFYPLGAFRDSRFKYIPVSHTKLKFPKGQGLLVTPFSPFFFEAE